MAPHVLHILRVRCIAEVVEPIVRRVAIVVANLHPFRHWANEREQNELMDGPHQPPDTHIGIAGVDDLVEDDAGMPGLPLPISSLGPTANAAEAGYLVSIIEWEGPPFFIIMPF